MNADRFTLKAQEALQTAAQGARAEGHPEITPEHLALALATQEGGTVPALLEKIGVPPAALAEALEGELGKLPHVQGDGHEPRLAPPLAKIVDLAEKIARDFKDDYVAAEHLFLAIVRDGRSKAAKLLSARGLPESAVLAALKEVRGSARVTDPGAEETYQALKRYARDLTELARRGKRSRAAFEARVHGTWVSPVAIACLPGRRRGVRRRPVLGYARIAPGRGVRAPRCLVGERDAPPAARACPAKVAG